MHVCAAQMIVERAAAGRVDVVKDALDLLVDVLAGIPYVAIITDWVLRAQVVFRSRLCACMRTIRSARGARAGGRGAGGGPPRACWTCWTCWAGDHRGCGGVGGGATGKTGCGGYTVLGRGRAGLGQDHAQRHRLSVCFAKGQGQGSSAYRWPSNATVQAQPYPNALAFPALHPVPSLTVLHLSAPC